jgi:alkylation response protein AidB-like acyl-CoA dehydrogenase
MATLNVKQTARRASDRSLVDGVREHLDDVRSRARATEEARRPLPETVNLVKRLGIVRALVPAVYGGLEHDTFDWLQSIRLLSSADMSAGWFAGLASAHSFGLAKFSKRVQDEIWGALGPDAIIASASANTQGGVAVPDGDGYRLSGRWRFSSGITVADWAILFIKVPDPVSGGAEPYWAMLPKSDFQVEDSWFTAGMRGSGSQDLVVADAFVPRHRLGGPGIDMPSACPGLHQNPLFDLPFLVIFPIIFASIALGGVEEALRLFAEQLKKRKAAMTGASLLESPLSHVRLGEAAMRVRAISTMMEDRWRDLGEHVLAARPIDAVRQMEWRVNDAYVGREATRIAELIIEGSGASVFFDTNPLQRFWRDLHATGGHTYFNTESAFQVLGRQMLGLPPDPNLV